MSERQTIVGIQAIMAYLGKSRSTIWRYTKTNPERFVKIGTTLILYV